MSDHTLLICDDEGLPTSFLSEDDCDLIGGTPHGLLARSRSTGQWFSTGAVIDDDWVTAWNPMERQEARDLLQAIADSDPRGGNISLRNGRVDPPLLARLMLDAWLP